MYELKLFGRAVVIASWPTTRYHIYWPLWLKKPVSVVVNHLAILVVALKGCVYGSIVIVREFMVLPFVPVALLLYPWRKRIILNLNDVFAQKGGALRDGAFRALSRMGYRMMLLDGANVEKELLTRKALERVLVPRFGAHDRRVDYAENRSAGGTSFRVGLVGDFRGEKGGRTALLDILEKLSYQPELDVAVGYWDEKILSAIPATLVGRLTIVNTFEFDNYLRFLASCNVVITHAGDAYRYRHSGVIMDAVSLGVIVVCPNYPVLRSQIETPVEVGITYSSLDDIPDAVNAALKMQPILTANFDRYLRERGPEWVSSDLERVWDGDVPSAVERGGSGATG
jgi:hypothetical protein